MKRFIKICAVTGLILLFLGLGITAVSAAMGGRFTSTLPSRMASRVWHNHMPWTLRWDNDRMDDWDGLYNWDNWDDWGDADNREDTDVTDRDHDSSQMTTVSDPSFKQARKLDLDVDKGVIRIAEKEGISQIQVNVQDIYGRTRCYMDESTLKSRGSPGAAAATMLPGLRF